ncbi:MAG: DUF1570 domain-containing protein [Phycisphaeraceae bacterium]
MPSRRLLSLALVVLTLAAAPGKAAEVRDGYGLAVFRSRFYEVHTNLEPDRVRPFAEHMDLVFAHFSKRFSGFEARRSERMPLFLLRTEADYHRLLERVGIDSAGSSGLFFRRGEVGGLATWIEDKPPHRTLQTLQHEGFHQFAWAYIGRLPLWLNEGLAEYFELSRLAGRKMTTGYSEAGRIDRVREAIREGRALSLRELVATTGKAWRETVAEDPAAGRLLYDQSWSVVYFLIHAAEGRYQEPFERYLLLLSEGESSSAAFREAFGADHIGEADRHWRYYAMTQQPRE